MGRAEPARGAEKVDAAVQGRPDGGDEGPEVVADDLDPLHPHARGLQRARQQARVALLYPPPEDLVARDQDGRARRAAGLSRRPRPPPG